MSKRQRTISRPQQGLLRWRWYHFYFVLALIDVLVILATLYANHRTIASFDSALEDVVASHERQRWLTDVWIAVSGMNAPGNDIFKSRDLHAERARLARARGRYDALTTRERGYDDIAMALEKNVRDMIGAAESIFARFEQILDHDVTDAMRTELLTRATRTMAEMDRAQADALARLADESLAGLARQEGILARHQSVLAGRADIEYVFIGVVGFILVGVFFYGRQLQRTHEKLESEQRRAQDERRNRLAEVGEVCFACAYGIRNPLSSILSSAQLVLKEGEVDQESRERVENIVRSSWFLDQCIAKLLTFAHSPTLKTETFPPEDVLEQAMGTLIDKIRSKNIQVARSFDPAKPFIQGDRMLLAQAAVEMISNAIDHVGEGGHVTLVTSRDAGDPEWVEFGVVDDGPGIPADVKNRACDLFFSRRPGGTGIGLATVKRAADLHNGTVLLRDAKPHGADVRIRLPA